MDVKGTYDGRGAVNLTMTTGGGWRTDGLDSEAFVVSQTADWRRGGRAVSFWANLKITGRAKTEGLKIYSKAKFSSQVSWFRARDNN